MQYKSIGIACIFYAEISVYCCITCVTFLHRLETTQLLLENGAHYYARSKYGDDALQTACLKGAVNIFEYLIQNIAYSNERLANAHELLGSTFLDEHNDLYNCIKHWRIAQTIRESTKGYILVFYLNTLCFCMLLFVKSANIKWYNYFFHKISIF